MFHFLSNFISMPWMIFFTYGRKILMIYHPMDHQPWIGFQLPWWRPSHSQNFHAQSSVVTSSCSVTQWRTEEKRMEWNGYVIYLVSSIHELKETEMSKKDHTLFSNTPPQHIFTGASWNFQNFSEFNGFVNISVIWSAIGI